MKCKYRYLHVCFCSCQGYILGTHLGRSYKLEKCLDGLDVGTLNHTNKCREDPYMAIGETGDIIYLSKVCFLLT